MAVQPAPYRFTVGEYYRMAEAGIFDEDDRVELLEGEIVDTAPIGSGHATCVRRITRFFYQQLGEHVTVAVQDPVRLNELSEPQPDVMLLRPRADYYAGDVISPAHGQESPVVLDVEAVNRHLGVVVTSQTAPACGVASAWTWASRRRLLCLEHDG